MTLFSTVLKWMASAPPATQVAPIRPPNSACDELEGRPEVPGRQVPQDRPDQAREDHHRVDEGLVDEPARDRLRDLHRQEGAYQVQTPGERHGDLGAQCAGGDRGGHGVGRVVEAVGEIEDQRGQHDHDHDHGYVHVPDLQSSRNPAGGRTAWRCHLIMRVDEAAACRAVIPEPSGRRSRPRRRDLQKAARFLPPSSRPSSQRVGRRHVERANVTVEIERKFEVAAAGEFVAGSRHGDGGRDGRRAARAVARGPVAELRTHRSAWGSRDDAGVLMAELVIDEVTGRVTGPEENESAWRRSMWNSARLLHPGMLDEVESRLGDHGQDGVVRSVRDDGLAHHIQHQSRRTGSRARRTTGPAAGRHCGASRAAAPRRSRRCCSPTERPGGTPSADRGDNNGAVQVPRTRPESRGTGASPA